MEEIWKDIEGYEGYYQVSSFGNVRGIDRVVFQQNNRKRFWKGKPIHIRTKVGYSYVQLCKNQIQIDYRVHRLVAIAFIETSDRALQVNHKNGVKTDNRVENLEWCTSSYNQRHSFENLNRKRSRAWLGVTGENNPKSKKIIDVSNGKVYSSVKECAESNGINRKTLNNKLCGRRANNTNFRYEVNSNR